MLFLDCTGHKYTKWKLRAKVARRPILERKLCHTFALFPQTCRLLLQKTGATLRLKLIYLCSFRFLIAFVEFYCKLNTFYKKIKCDLFE